MKIAYIAHPIAGDVKGNIAKVLKIVREINLTEPDTVAFAHYIVDLHALDDNTPEERERGIKNDTALIKAGFITECRLYGDRISSGMQDEIDLFRSLGVEIIPMTKETKKCLKT